MLPRYGFQNLRLLFTDIDSVRYQVFTDDLYKDMFNMREHFDASDYPPDHFLYSRDNAKVLGKMEDECNGQAPLEFVGLRAKMYSFHLPNSKQKMTAKGIKNHLSDITCGMRCIYIHC